MKSQSSKTPSSKTPSSKSQPSPKPCRLTVAIIVRDAAETLAGTLESVRAIADQVVVLDTGSTDETPQVAKEHGAVFHRHGWQDDFSAARNACAERASGDWILWLDAGEQMEPQQAVELRGFVDTQADLGKAYMMLVQIPPSSPQGSIEQAGRIRLVPRRSELQFAGRVRETLLPAIAALGMQVEGLPWRIMRGSHVHDKGYVAAKARRDLRLAETEMSSIGRKAAMIALKGESLTSLGDFGGAVAEFREAINVAESGSIEMLEAYYGLLTAIDGTESFSDEHRLQTQTAVALEALQIFSVDAQLLCAMGNYLQAQSKLELAARSFQLAYQNGQINPRLWHLADVNEIAAACWALSLGLQGHDDQATAALEEATAKHPRSQRLHRLLLRLYVKSGRQKEALALVDQIAPETGGREMLRTAVRGACLAAEDNWIAAQTYLETAFNAGCRDVICLRAYATTLLSTGQLELAEPILWAWHDQQPQDVEVAQYLKAIAEQRLAKTGEQGDDPQEPTPQETPVPPSQSEIAGRNIRIDETSTFDAVSPHAMPDAMPDVIPGQLDPR